MGRTLILALFLLVAGATSSQEAEDQVHGKFEGRDGSMCVWFELRKSERGNIFVTACHCKNKEGGRQSYSCEYDGPMGECDVYRRSPVEFYDSIANALQSK